MTDTDRAFNKFRKAALKQLGKTMGRVGLCTVESYIGGEFFEPNYLDTRDPRLARCFPHMKAPVGGVGFTRIARASSDWHQRARAVDESGDIPLLGLFKERSEGAGHSFGTTAVRGFTGLTDEKIMVNAEYKDAKKPANTDALRLLTLGQLEDSFGLTDEAYQNAGFGPVPDDRIDAFRITPGYRDFVSNTRERHRRPSALRDVLTLPADVTGCAARGLLRELERFSLSATPPVHPRTAVGQTPGADGTTTIRLLDGDLSTTASSWSGCAALMGRDIHDLHITDSSITLRATGRRDPVRTGH